MKCVVYMLRKDAKIWWNAVKKTRNVVVMTYAKFLIEFNSKYYSQAICCTTSNLEMTWKTHDDVEG